MGMHLRKGEKLVREVHLHWSNYILSGTWAFFGFFITIGVAFGNSPSQESNMGPLITSSIVFFGPLLWKALVNKCKSYVVKNQRVYVEIGVVAKIKLDIPYHKITDVRLSQNLVQRIFGAGNVHLYTGNSLPINVLGISTPNEFKEEIFDVISKTKQEAV